MTDEFAIKQIKEGKYSESRMVTVTDNWYPNYPNDQIELNINIYLRENNKARVCMSVWGMDDDQMVLHSPDMNPVYALFLYNTWKKYIFDRVPDGCNAV